MTDKIDQALTELKTTLKQFMPVKQDQILVKNLNHSEESGVFVDILLNFSARIKQLGECV